MSGDLKEPPGLPRITLFGHRAPETKQGSRIAVILLQSLSVESFRFVKLLLLTTKIADVSQEFEIIGCECQGQFISRPRIIDVAFGS